MDDWTLCGCKYCNPTSYKNWSRAWKLAAKRFRTKYLNELQATRWWLQNFYLKIGWARVWKKAAKEFRDLSLELTQEWEDERDRYQDALFGQDSWRMWYGYAIEQRDEARRLAIHFKRKADERGEWMGNRLLSAACENRRRRELEKRISVLEAVCREALDAAEYCTEPPFEELREALGVEEERWINKGLMR